MKFVIFLTLPLVINAGIAGINLSEQKFKPKCEYIPEERSYNCRYIVEVFPKIFYGNYLLKCNDCLIPIFRKETFPYNNDLVAMNLSNSKMMNIASNAFESLTTLQYIYMQNNIIMNISADAFFGLRQVYELHLEHNELTALTPKFMNGFEASTIIMAHNKLTEIPENIFEGIFGAMTLDISYNKIHNLYVNSFNYLKGLEYLDLQHNDLCNIPLGLFKHIRSLKEVNLAHNNFKKFNFGTFSGLPNLEVLNLSHNALIEFDASILIPLEQVSYLDISGNGLDYLDGVTLHLNAPDLKVVAISDNSWRCTSLIHLVQYLKSKNIIILEHDKYEVTNIKGIACVDKKITSDKLPFDTFYKIAEELTNTSYTYC